MVKQTEDSICPADSTEPEGSTYSEYSPRLIPVTSWNNHHDWPPPGGMRHLIFHEHENGFHKCVLRVGRRVLIDERAFFEWVREQGGAAK